MHTRVFSTSVFLSEDTENVLCAANVSLERIGTQSYTLLAQISFK